MLAVGLSGIGTKEAQQAHGFGMRIAMRRLNTPTPEYVERFGHAAHLPKMLPGADVVVICLPLTAETRGFIARDALAAMKPGTILMNISHGGSLDAGPLVAAFRRSRLSGASFDVTDPEPLQSGHPPWSRLNVGITPRVALNTELTEERRWALLRDYLRCSGTGERLPKVVHRKAA
jgi:phosphoglycerate dehydrogenase-like enzyme